MLEIHGLSISYGMHRALAGVSVNVAPGEIVVILGANGAGKSSLLRAIAGMSEGQVEGVINLGGQPLLGLSADVIVEKGIAFVPEGRGIFGDLTVAENLALGAYSERARVRMQENLNVVYGLFPKLIERKGQIVRTMSGGEQQMVAIGRAIMAAPEILMLDEPSLGLSPLLCKELFQSLAHISGTGMGVLLVEQNAKQSLAIADRGYLMENGEITGEDKATSLLNDPAVQAAYLGGSVASKELISSKVAAPITGDKQFIRPGSASGVRYSSDVLAGENISNLVARATATQTQTESPRSKLPASGRLIDQIQSQTTPDTSAYTVERDPEVAQLLAELEMAAAGARNTRISTDQKIATSQIFPDSALVEESLPVIPVWRRKTVQVWRRDENGTLIKED